jgi:tellurite resistance protein TerC
MMGAPGGEYSFAAVSSSRSVRLAPGCGSGTVGSHVVVRPRAEETSVAMSPSLPEVLKMHVSTTAWILTITVMAVVLIFDIVVIGRRPHEPTMRECAIAISIFVGLAVAFGLAIWAIYGGTYSGQFFAGWITEYSLSIDNLFVFIIIMGALNVPRKYQQTALLVGIILALVFRGIFIAVGAALINEFSWVFYIFGAFLVYTAIGQARQSEDEDGGDNAMLRFIRTRLPFSDEFDGTKLFTRKNGKRLATPMLLVIIALGTTDLLFALDSIPAIFGLTNEPYLVFTANVFALMGLRQLYFLIGGLLKRLVYLHYGLAIILAFIGVKLVFHAMHVNELPFVNGGEPIHWAPEIGIATSLIVIGATIVVTTVASLLRTRSLTRQD